MSLQSCPKCGYAIPAGGWHCRHCDAILKRSPGRGKLDLRIVMLWCTGVLTVIFLYGGLFTGKYHPKFSFKQAPRAHGLVRPILAAR